MASVEVNSHLNSHAFLVDSDDIGCWGIGASGYTGAFRDSWNISGLNSDDDRVNLSFIFPFCTRYFDPKSV